QRKKWKRAVEVNGQRLAHAKMIWSRCRFAQIEDSSDRALTETCRARGSALLLPRPAGRRVWGCARREEPSEGRGARPPRKRKRWHRAALQGGPGKASTGRFRR